MTELYRHYNDNNDLLYVGISLSAVHRLSQHKKSKHNDEIAKVTIERYDTRERARLAEKQVIIFEKPKYNIEHNNKLKCQLKVRQHTERYSSEPIEVCPFCGSQPEHWPEMELEGNGYTDYWYITCFNPECNIKPSTAGYAPFDGSPVWFWNNKKFIISHSSGRQKTAAA